MAQSSASSPLLQDKARLLAEVQRLERALAAAQAKGKGAKKNTSERRGRPAFLAPRRSRYTIQPASCRAPVTWGT
jgi:hypothetical protein